MEVSVMGRRLKPIKCGMLLCLMSIGGNVSSRTVVSYSTHEPIAYASVGIVNRNLGTVTDSLGNFTLSVPLSYMNDTLRISSIGYVAKSFAVRDFKSIPDTIELCDNAVELAEVVVKPQRIKHRVAGRKTAGGFIYIEVEGYKAAGQGLAIPLNVKKRAWIKELGFTIVVNDAALSRMKFRINVYRKDGDVYELESIKPIYFNYSKSDLVDGKFRFMFPDELMLDEGEYYVELEFLENFRNEIFLMKTKPLTGRTRYRYASQSDWETLPFGAPIFIEYDCLE